MGDIEDEVYRLTAQIPRGQVSTYGAIAAALGDRIAARAVGRMMADNPRPIKVPCHRVVRSDGGLGGYSGGGTAWKQQLLREEGVETGEGKVLELQRYLFTRFDTTSPLRKLREEQSSMAARLCLVDDFDPEVPLCALDIAYRGNKGWCAAVLTSQHAGREISNAVIEDDVDFPYIPTYLAYRELPLMTRCLDTLEVDEVLLLVDGNGIYHPRMMGIASHIGLERSLPSIGIAKSSITKHPPSEGILEMDGKITGAVVRLGRKSLYVSPGHRISIESAVAVVRHLGEKGYIATLGRAHALATEAANI